MTDRDVAGIEYKKGQKPRVAELNAGEVASQNALLDRFEEIIIPGILRGLEIQGDAGEPEGIGSAWYDESTSQWLVNITPGKAIDVLGRMIEMPGNGYDGNYVPSNPDLEDSQVPPVPIPQSTGRMRVPLTESGPNLLRCYIVLDYLSTVDQTRQSTQVRGTQLGYPYRMDGYKISVRTSPTVVNDNVAAGALYLGYIEGYADASPGTIHNDIPDDLPPSVSFTREVFSLNLVDHIADENSHHNQSHTHSTLGSGKSASAEVNGNGEVLIGAEKALDSGGELGNEPDEVRVGGENYRRSLKKLFERNGIVNFRGENDSEEPTYDKNILQASIQPGGGSRSDYVRVYLPGTTGAGIANGRVLEEVQALGVQTVDWDEFYSGPDVVALDLYFSPGNSWAPAQNGTYDIFVTQFGVLKYLKRSAPGTRIAPVEDLLLATVEWTYYSGGVAPFWGELTALVDMRQFLWPMKWDRGNNVEFPASVSILGDVAAEGTITGQGGNEGMIIKGGIVMWDELIVDAVGNEVTEVSQNVLYHPKHSTGEIDTRWAVCTGYGTTPDLRQRFVVGVSGSGYGMGNLGGEAEVSLTLANIASHYHTIVHTHRASSNNSQGNLDDYSGLNNADHRHTFGKMNNGTNESWFAEWAVDPQTGGRDNGSGLGTGQLETGVVKFNDRAYKAPGTWYYGLGSRQDTNHRHATYIMANAGGVAGENTSGYAGSTSAGAPGTPHENRPPFYTLAYIKRIA